MPGHAVFDANQILEQFQTFRRNGLTDVRNSGIEVDEILANEVASPNTDTRYGVNIITRPSPSVVEAILKIQNHLRALEPGQYYYPIQDLHATILEIRFCIPMPEMLELVEKISHALPSLLQDLPCPSLEAAGLGFDQKGCALGFVPRGPHLQELRAKLRGRMENLGIPLMSRYSLTAAHVSLFRYIQPLRSDKNQWADYLSSTSVDSCLTWQISSLTITWGAIWYSSHTQIHTLGPLSLGSK